MKFIVCRHFMARFLCFFVVTTLLLDVTVVASSQNRRLRRSHHQRKLRSDPAADDSYLIKFVSLNDASLVHSSTMQVTAWYPHAQAAAVRNVTEDDVFVLLDDENVVYVEADGWVQGLAVAETPAASTTNWPMDWIDNAELDQSFSNTAYSGKGVRVYVVDSGIQLDHEEFLIEKNGIATPSSRASCAKNFHSTEGCEDTWGHGTHVAALIGGRTFGVAPEVELISLKVLGQDGKARFSEVVSALEYIVNQEEIAGDESLAIVNLSLGTPRIAELLNEAVSKTVSAGIPVIVAAGNGGADACDWSPASSSGSIAVGALGRDGEPISDSNFGPCVDLYAPGFEITSAWSHPVASDFSNTISGTSSASPFVTGVAALHLERDPSLSPEQLFDAMETNAVNGNILTISDLLGTPTEQPTSAPTALKDKWFAMIRDTVQRRFWKSGGS